MKARLIKKIGAGRVDAAGRMAYVQIDRRGKKSRAVCRVDDYHASVPEGDAYMDQSGCLGEFMEDWQRADRRDGCPRCIEAGMP